MKMRPVPAIEVKAKGEAVLKPGGLHVMLIDLKAPMKEGDTVPITLTFDDGSSKQVDAKVVRAVAGANADGPQALIFGCFRASTAPLGNSPGGADRSGHGCECLARPIRPGRQPRPMRENDYLRQVVNSITDDSGRKRHHAFNDSMRGLEP